MAVINTSSGLGGLFDQLSAQLNERAQQQGFYDAYAQARGAQPLSAGQQPGYLSRLLGNLTGSSLADTSKYRALPGGAPAAPASPAPQGGVLNQLLGAVGLGGQPQAGAPAAAQPAQPGPVASPAPAQAAPMAFAAPSSTPSMVASRPAVSAPPAFAPAPTGPLPTFAAAGGAPGQDNTSRAMAFYQAKGLSPIAASALVGGFHAESGKGLNTNAANVGDGTDGSTSVGIAQWNGDRAAGLRQYAAERAQPGRPEHPAPI
ncbi:phage tail tip lysozyme [Lichenihabitans sp. Uapishka_5]|uniref:phage tail tip lysozyme n=1 Tax=Lichenihabitans sp. Uapishka_5 TaxID=3037302 RepID=UPI0029E7EA2A|nr:phage tail tip lysozyme [Lichenihabitans sp. Uapishka_5]MDX7952164.1 phage tail tip lysozyme [Lichenihabitans sp. Uapishka_5]